MPQRHYLDHAATSPMRPEARAAVADAMGRWANASSPHAEGRAARAALEGARERIGTALGWSGHVVLTSGASEALAIALGRAKGARRLLSAVEHDAAFRAAPAAGVLPVAADGALDLDALDDALTRHARPVVAVQHVNAETGRIQPVAAIAERVRDAGGIFIVDAAQSAAGVAAGRCALPDADGVIVSAHKLGGPPGVGALLVRDLGLLEPSGGQEFGYRGGTENVPGALGFAAALEAAGQGARPADAAALDDTLRHAGATVVGGGTDRAPHIRAYAMPGIAAAAQLVRADLAGFAISAGSACASGTLKPSRVLAAFGVAPDVAARTIRVSTGWSTTPADLAAFAAWWEATAIGAQARSARQA